MEGKDIKEILPLFHTNISNMFQETITCVGCGVVATIMRGGPKCCTKRVCLEAYWVQHDKQIAENIKNWDARKAELMKNKKPL